MADIGKPEKRVKVIPLETPRREPAAPLPEKTPVPEKIPA